ncbi:MAG: GNAT family N-acetyltransferase [Endomicrobiales bacterium]|nr:GNAT family N-acetyltransferase [Endomicrobiales bacterium]
MGILYEKLEDLIKYYSEQDSRLLSKDFLNDPFKRPDLEKTYDGLLGQISDIFHLKSLLLEFWTQYKFWQPSKLRSAIEGRFEKSDMGLNLLQPLHDWINKTRSRQGGVLKWWQWLAWVISHPLSAAFTETIGLAVVYSILTPTPLIWGAITLVFAALHIPQIIKKCIDISREDTPLFRRLLKMTGVIGGFVLAAAVVVWLPFNYAFLPLGINQVLIQNLGQSLLSSAVISAILHFIYNAIIVPALGLIPLELGAGETKDKPGGTVGVVRWMKTWFGVFVLFLGIALPEFMAQRVCQARFIPSEAMEYVLNRTVERGNFDISVSDTHDEMGRRAAERWVSMINQELERLGADETVLTGWQTGSTPIPIYNALTTVFRAAVDWSRVQTSNLDEHVYDGEYILQRYGGDLTQEEQSYVHYMWENVFKHIKESGFDPNNIHFLNGIAPDLTRECREYEEILRNTGIFLQFAGAGSNGHVAFNEPAIEVDEEFLQKLVQNDAETLAKVRDFNEFVLKVPAERYEKALQSLTEARERQRDKIQDYLRDEFRRRAEEKGEEYQEKPGIDRLADEIRAQRLIVYVSDEYFKTGPERIIGINERFSRHNLNLANETNLLESKTHVVDLAVTTILDNSRFYDDLSDMRVQALTMGIGTILSAQHILWNLACEKRSQTDRQAFGKVLSDTLYGPVTPSIPSTALQKHPSVMVYVDKYVALSAAKRGLKEWIDRLLLSSKGRIDSFQAAIVKWSDFDDIYKNRDEMEGFYFAYDKEREDIERRGGIIELNGKWFDVYTMIEKGKTVFLIIPKFGDNLQKDHFWYRRKELNEYFFNKELNVNIVRLVQAVERFSAGRITHGERLGIVTRQTQKVFDETIGRYRHGDVYDPSKNLLNSDNYLHTAHFGWLYHREIEMIQKISMQRGLERPIIHDLGTGLGSFIFSADKSIESARLLGTDVQEDIIEYGAKSYAPEADNIKFITANPESINSSDDLKIFSINSFGSPADFIVLNHVLEHLEGIETFDGIARYIETWLEACNHGVMISVPFDEGVADLSSITPHIEEGAFNEEKLRDIAARFAKTRPDIEVDSSNVNVGLLAFVKKKPAVLYSNATGVISQMDIDDILRDVSIDQLKALTTFIKAKKQEYIHLIEEIIAESRKKYSIRYADILPEIAGIDEIFRSIYYNPNVISSLKHYVSNRIGIITIATQLIRENDNVQRRISDLSRYTDRFDELIFFLEAVIEQGAATVSDETSKVKPGGAGGLMRVSTFERYLQDEHYKSPDWERMYHSEKWYKKVWINTAVRVWASWSYAPVVEHSEIADILSNSPFSRDFWYGVWGFFIGHYAKPTTVLGWLGVVFWPIQSILRVAGISVMAAAWYLIPFHREAVNIAIHRAFNVVTTPLFASWLMSDKVRKDQVVRSLIEQRTSEIAELDGRLKISSYELDIINFADLEIDGVKYRYRWETNLERNNFIEFFYVDNVMVAHGFTNLHEDGALIRMGYNPGMEDIGSTHMKILFEMKLNVLKNRYGTEGFIVPNSQFKDWNTFFFYIRKGFMPVDPLARDKVLTYLSLWKTGTVDRLKYDEIKEIFGDYFTFLGTCGDLVFSLQEASEQPSPAKYDEQVLDEFMQRCSNEIDELDGRLSEKSGPDTYNAVALGVDGVEYQYEWWESISGLSLDPEHYTVGNKDVAHGFTQFHIERRDEARMGMGYNLNVNFVESPHMKILFYMKLNVLKNRYGITKFRVMKYQLTDWKTIFFYIRKGFLPENPEMRAKVLEYIVRWQRGEVDILDEEQIQETFGSFYRFISKCGDFIFTIEKADDRFAAPAEGKTYRGGVWNWLRAIMWGVFSRIFPEVRQESFNSVYDVIVAPFIENILVTVIANTFFGGNVIIAWVLFIALHLLDYAIDFVKPGKKIAPPSLNMIFPALIGFTGIIFKLSPLSPLAVWLHMGINTVVTIIKKFIQGRDYDSLKADASLSKPGSLDTRYFEDIVGWFRTPIVSLIARVFPKTGKERIGLVYDRYIPTLVRIVLVLVILSASYVTFFLGFSDYYPRFINVFAEMIGSDQAKQLILGSWIIIVIYSFIIAPLSPVSIGLYFRDRFSKSLVKADYDQEGIDTTQSGDVKEKKPPLINRNLKRYLLVCISLIIPAILFYTGFATYLWGYILHLFSAIKLTAVGEVIVRSMLISSTQGRLGIYIRWYLNDALIIPAILCANYALFSSYKIEQPTSRKEKNISKAFTVTKMIASLAVAISFAYVILYTHFVLLNPLFSFIVATLGIRFVIPILQKYIFSGKNTEYQKSLKYGFIWAALFNALSISGHEVLEGKFGLTGTFDWMDVIVCLVGTIVFIILVSIAISKTSYPQSINTVDYKSEVKPEASVEPDIPQEVAPIEPDEEKPEPQSDLHSEEIIFSGLTREGLKTQISEYSAKAVGMKRRRRLNSRYLGGAYESIQELHGFSFTHSDTVDLAQESNSLAEFVVADIGAGYGFVSRDLLEETDGFFASIFPEMKETRFRSLAFEVNEFREEVEKEQERRSKRDDSYYQAVEWSFGETGEDLPYEDETATLALATRSIEYMYDPLRGIEELYRILKVNGKASAVLSLMNEETYAEAMEAFETDLLEDKDQFLGSVYLEGVPIFSEIKRLQQAGYDIRLCVIDNLSHLRWVKTDEGTWRRGEPLMEVTPEIEAEFYEDTFYFNRDHSNYLIIEIRKRAEDPGPLRFNYDIENVENLYHRRYIPRDTATIDVTPVKKPGGAGGLMRLSTFERYLQDEHYKSPDWERMYHSEKWYRKVWINTAVRVWASWSYAPVVEHSEIADIFSNSPFSRDFWYGVWGFFIGHYAKPTTVLGWIGVVFWPIQSVLRVAGISVMAAAWYLIPFHREAVNIAIHRAFNIVTTLLFVSWLMKNKDTQIDTDSRLSQFKQPVLKSFRNISSGITLRVIMSALSVLSPLVAIYTLYYYLSPTSLLYGIAGVQGSIIVMVILSSIFGIRAAIYYGQQAFGIWRASKLVENRDSAEEPSYILRDILNYARPGYYEELVENGIEIRTINEKYVPSRVVRDSGKIFFEINPALFVSLDDELKVQFLQHDRISVWFKQQTQSTEYNFYSLLLKSVFSVLTTIPFAEQVIVSIGEVRGLRIIIQYALHRQGRVLFGTLVGLMLSAILQQYFLYLGISDLVSAAKVGLYAGLAIVFMPLVKQVAFDDWIKKVDERFSGRPNVRMLIVTLVGSLSFYFLYPFHAYVRQFLKLISYKLLTGISAGLEVRVGFPHTTTPNMDELYYMTFTYFFLRWVGNLFDATLGMLIFREGMREVNKENITFKKLIFFSIGIAVTTWSWLLSIPGDYSIVKFQDPYYGLIMPDTITRVLHGDVQTIVAILAIPIFELLVFFAAYQISRFIDILRGVSSPAVPLTEEEKETNLFKRGLIKASKIITTYTKESSSMLKGASLSFIVSTLILSFVAVLLGLGLLFVGNTSFISNYALAAMSVIYLMTLPSLVYLKLSLRKKSKISSTEDEDIEDKFEKVSISGTKKAGAAASVIAGVEAAGAVTLVTVGIIFNLPALIWAVSIAVGVTIISGGALYIISRSVKQKPQGILGVFVAILEAGSVLLAPFTGILLMKNQKQLIHQAQMEANKIRAGPIKRVREEEVKAWLEENCKGLKFEEVEITIDELEIARPDIAAAKDGIIYIDYLAFSFLPDYLRRSIIQYHENTHRWTALEFIAYGNQILHSTRFLSDMLSKNKARGLLVKFNEFSAQIGTSKKIIEDLCRNIEKELQRKDDADFEIINQDFDNIVIQVQLLFALEEEVVALSNKLEYFKLLFIHWGRTPFTPIFGYTNLFLKTKDVKVLKRVLEIIPANLESMQDKVDMIKLRSFPDFADSILEVLESPKNQQEYERARELAEFYIKRLDGVKAVLLDVGGVVIQPDLHAAGARFKKYFNELGFAEYTSESELLDIYTKFRNGSGIEYRRNKEGDSEVSFDAYVDLFNSYLAGRDIPIRLTPLDFANLFKKPWKSDRRTVSALNRLAGNFRLATVSDQHTDGSNWSETQSVNEALTAALGNPEELFERQFVSWQEGHTKSDQEYFAHILQETGLTPEEVAFADDMPNYVENASTEGMLGSTVDSAQSLSKNLLIDELVTGEWRRKAGKLLKKGPAKLRRYRNRFRKAFKPLKDVSCPLLEDSSVETLVDTSRKLAKAYPTERIVAIGRTPVWIVETARLLEWDSDRFEYVAFSGRWHKRNARLVEKDKEHPGREQVLRYRQYLSGLDLDPISIINRPERTVFTDHIFSGESMVSFITVLVEWAEELDATNTQIDVVDELKRKMALHILHELHSPEYVLETMDYMIGFDITYQRINTPLLVFLGRNIDSYDANLGISYPYTDWDNPDIDPRNAQVTRNARLLYFRIVDFLVGRKLLGPEYLDRAMRSIETMEPVHDILTAGDTRSEGTPSEGFVYTIDFKKSVDIDDYKWQRNRIQKYMKATKDLNFRWAAEVDMDSITSENDELLRMVTARRIDWLLENEQVQYSHEGLAGNTMSRDFDFILWELYKNACDAYTRLNDEGPIEVSLSQAGENVTIDFIDYGIGLETIGKRENGSIRIVSNTPVGECRRDHLYSSQGVGIIWCQLLVQLHGGTFEYISEKVEDDKSGKKHRTIARITLPKDAIQLESDAHEEVKPETTLRLFNVPFWSELFETIALGVVFAFIQDPVTRMLALGVFALIHIITDIYNLRQNEEYRKKTAFGKLFHLLGNVVKRFIASMVVIWVPFGVSDYFVQVKVASLIAGAVISFSWHIYYNVLIDNQVKFLKKWPKLRLSRKADDKQTDEQSVVIPEEPPSDPDELKQELEKPYPYGETDTVKIDKKPAKMLGLEDLYAGSSDISDYGTCIRIMSFYSIHQRDIHKQALRNIQKTFPVFTTDFIARIIKYSDSPEQALSRFRQWLDALDKHPEVLEAIVASAETPEEARSLYWDIRYNRPVKPDYFDFNVTPAQALLYKIRFERYSKDKWAHKTWHPALIKWANMTLEKQGLPELLKIEEQESAVSPETDRIVEVEKAQKYTLVNTLISTLFAGLLLLGLGLILKASILVLGILFLIPVLFIFVYISSSLWASKNAHYKITVREKYLEYEARKKLDASGLEDVKIKVVKERGYSPVRYEKRGDEYTVILNPNLLNRSFMFDRLFYLSHISKQIKMSRRERGVLRKVLDFIVLHLVDIVLFFRAALWDTIIGHRPWEELSSYISGKTSVELDERYGSPMKAFDSFKKEFEQGIIPDYIALNIFESAFKNKEISGQAKGYFLNHLSVCLKEDRDLGVMDIEKLNVYFPEISRARLAQEFEGFIDKVASDKEEIIALCQRIRAEIQKGDSAEQGNIDYCMGVINTKSYKLLDSLTPLFVMMIILGLKDFEGDLSHWTRTCSAAIIGYVELYNEVYKAKGDFAKLDEFLRNIESQIERLDAQAREMKEKYLKDSVVIDESAVKSEKEYSLIHNVLVWIPGFFANMAINLSAWILRMIGIADRTANFDVLYSQIRQINSNISYYNETQGIRKYWPVEHKKRDAKIMMALKDRLANVKNPQYYIDYEIRDGLIAGYIVYSIRPSDSPEYPGSLYIDLIAADPSAFGTDISIKLMKKAFKFAQKNNIDTVYLNCFKDNERGVNFYENKVSAQLSDIITAKPKEDRPGEDDQFRFVYTVKDLPQERVITIGFWNNIVKRFSRYTAKPQDLAQDMIEQLLVEQDEKWLMDNYPEAVNRDTFHIVSNPNNIESKVQDLIHLKKMGINAHGIAFAPYSTAGLVGRGYEIQKEGPVSPVVMVNGELQRLQVWKNPKTGMILIDKPQGVEFKDQNEEAQALYFIACQVMYRGFIDKKVNKMLISGQPKRKFRNKKTFPDVVFIDNQEMIPGVQSKRLFGGVEISFPDVANAEKLLANAMVVSEIDQDPEMETSLLRDANKNILASERVNLVMQAGALRSNIGMFLGENRTHQRSSSAVMMARSPLALRFGLAELKAEKRIKTILDLPGVVETDLKYWPSHAGSTIVDGLFKDGALNEDYLNLSRKQLKQGEKYFDGFTEDEKKYVVELTRLAKGMPDVPYGEVADQFKKTYIAKASCALWVLKQIEKNQSVTGIIPSNIVTEAASVNTFERLIKGSIYIGFSGMMLSIREHYQESVIDLNRNLLEFYKEAQDSRYLPSGYLTISIPARLQNYDEFMEISSKLGISVVDERFLSSAESAYTDMRANTSLRISFIGSDVASRMDLNNALSNILRQASEQKVPLVILDADLAMSEEIREARITTVDFMEVVLDVLGFQELDPAEKRKLEQSKGQRYFQGGPVPVFDNAAKQVVKRVLKYAEDSEAFVGDEALMIETLDALMDISFNYANVKESDVRKERERFKLAVLRYKQRYENSSNLEAKQEAVHMCMNLVHGICLAVAESAYLSGTIMDEKYKPVFLQYILQAINSGSDTPELIRSGNYTPALPQLPDEYASLSVEELLEKVLANSEGFALEDLLALLWLNASRELSNLEILKTLKNPVLIAGQQAIESAA